MVPGEAFTINDRDVTFDHRHVILSGSFDNGDPLYFRLNAFLYIDRYYFDPNATLTVTLVSPVVLGDVNLDGLVTFADIHAFIQILLAS